MFQKYERKAEDILEKLGQEEPNERNFKMLSEALIVMAGGKIMEAMGGGEMGRYDGEDEYYNGRGGRGGRGGFTGSRGGRGGSRGGSRMGSSRGGRGSRYDGMRYDGGMEEDERERYERMREDQDMGYDGEMGGGRRR